MEQIAQPEVVPRPAGGKPAKAPAWWSRLWREVKIHRHSYMHLAPYMSLFFLFTVIPVAIALFISFTYFNLLEFPKFIGWQNYARLFLEDDIFLISVKNTIIFAAITGPVSYVACFLFAWIINEMSPKVRAFMTLVFYAPS